jgi:hypothetical protein
MVAAKRIFCTNKDVLTLMNTEMSHHNVNGIKYLMEKFDWTYFDIKTVIKYSFSHCHYCSELMLWMLKTFGYNRFDSIFIGTTPRFKQPF